MATLKVKKIKGHEYFYWSKSVRSRKRYGGTGKVMTVDFLIGATPTGQWLPYRLWAGEAQLQEYAEAVVKHLCPPEWAAFVEVSINWRRQKISIRSQHPWFADCRSRRWQAQRKALQSCLDQIIKVSSRIESAIEMCAYHLALHDEYMAKAKESREAAREARFKPIEGWADADLYFDERAAEWESFADKVMQEFYLRDWERLPMFAPPSQRSQFRREVMAGIERLSQNCGWYEQYKAEVD